MTSMQLSSCFVLLTLFSPAAAFAQGPDAWDREAGQKELDGMRRYAWALSKGTAGALKQMPAEEFTAVHAFLEDFDAARKDIDPQNAPSEWKMIDLEKLAIRNPKYWAAIYELEPAAPVTMWFHASLYAVNGEVAPTPLLTTARRAITD